jgi:hypothetical protein
MPEQASPSSMPIEGSVVQIKVWLLQLSPMVWRRVLVPSSCTLRELHGIIQAAMGWEGLHLYQFHLRAVRYGSCELSASSPEVTLAALHLRKGARLTYEYDLNIPWRHEIRVEDYIAAEPDKPYPRCTGAAPAAEGPAHLRTAADRKAISPLWTRRSRWTRSPISRPWPRSSSRSCENVGWTSSTTRPAGAWSGRWRAARPESVRKGAHSRGVPSTRACAKASTAFSCISKADAFSSALGEQFGRQQRRLVSALPADASDERMGGRVGELVEPALQRGGGRLGIMPRRHDARVAEEMLQIGDVHPSREQPGGHRVPQQMGIDALGYPGRMRHLADDLADALAGQGVRHRAGTLLAAGEQRSGPTGADVQPEQLGQLAADRHLAPLAALALANDHDALGKADVLDPQLDQLGDPHAGFEQGLQHQPGPAVPGIGLIEEAQLFLHREAVHAAKIGGNRHLISLQSGT